MPGPALNYLTDEEMEANECLPEEQKAKQIGSDKFKLTSWPGYQLISDNARRTWGKTLPTEWFCEAHGPSVFKAIITGDPYQVRALIVNATNPINSYGDSKMTLQALKQCEFLVTVDYWMTPTALLSDYVFPAAGALERPTIVTHYGATDSILGGKRAMQPLYDRHTDMTFWRKLGIACGQPKCGRGKTEEAYYHILEPLGLPISCYEEFVDNYRMYYPPLEQVHRQRRLLDPLGQGGVRLLHPARAGVPRHAHLFGLLRERGGRPRGGREVPHRAHHGRRLHALPSLRAFPDARHPLSVSRSVLHHQPVLAEKLGIAEGDWCWIETRRGRIKMRANVSPELDPRVVFAPRGWWFPERDGSADLSNPFGCLESNVNVLTSVDVEDCDPMGGSWANRGLMCRV